MEIRNRAVQSGHDGVVLREANPRRYAVARPPWLSARVWPFHVHTISVANREVAYTDEGTGPVLVFVEEGMWQFIWGSVMARLRGVFRVVALDFPGTGLSPGAAEERPSLARDSEFLEAFVDRLALRDVVLVLHDLAGPVGAGLAARRPELVRGLVFTQTFTWPPVNRGLRAMLRLMSSPPIRAINVATNLIPRVTTRDFGVGRGLDAEGRAAFLKPFDGPGPRRRFHGLMAAVLRETAFLRGVETALATTLADRAVLTIFGEKNDPFDYQLRYRELFPNATQLVIPGGGHYPMADDAEGFATAVSEWHREFFGNDAVPTDPRGLKS